MPTTPSSTSDDDNRDGETFANSPAIAAMKGDSLSRAERNALLAQEQGTPF